jgi:hypothetical protein
MNSMTQVHTEMETAERRTQASATSHEQTLGALAADLERISAQLKQLQEQGRSEPAGRQTSE